VIRLLKAKLKALLGGSSPGFTLAEVLVTVGLMGIIMSLMGGALFQALGIQRWWQDDVIATKELRNAGSWLSGDTFNATATDLVDGNPAVSSVTMSWTDTDSVSHTASYSYDVVGNRLVRDYDGIQHTVARRVASAGFSLSGKMLTFDLEVNASRGGTESKSLTVNLRRLQ